MTNISDQDPTYFPDFNQALADKLTLRQVNRAAHPNVEPVYSRRQIEQAFLETFDLIGGIPRLAIWANKSDDNYALFLQLMMKLAPKEAHAKNLGTVIEYRSNIPPSPLIKGSPQAPSPSKRTDGDIIDV